MTAKRETTGPAAKLVLTAGPPGDFGRWRGRGHVRGGSAGRAGPLHADRRQPGEFPSLPARARSIGVGNGDPTSHESDKGSSRKAFNGLCMALVQSTKTAGNITVEASSPGLTPGQRHDLLKGREAAPAGGGLGARGPGGRGHHRPVETRAGAADAGAAAAVSAAAPARSSPSGRTANALTGTVEGAAAAAAAAGRHARRHRRRQGGWRQHLLPRRQRYLHRNVKGDQIELQRTGAALGGRGGRGAPAADQTPRPAIGPPPDGSDPSNGATIAALTGTAAARGGGQPQTPLRSCCTA